MLTIRSNSFRMYLSVTSWFRMFIISVFRLVLNVLVKKCLSMCRNMGQILLRESITPVVTSRNPWRNCSFEIVSSLENQTWQQPLQSSRRDSKVVHCNILITLVSLNLFKLISKINKKTHLAKKVSSENNFLENSLSQHTS